MEKPDIEVEMERRNQRKRLSHWRMAFIICPLLGVGSGWIGANALAYHLTQKGYQDMDNAGNRAAAVTMAKNNQNKANNMGPVGRFAFFGFVRANESYLEKVAQEERAKTDYSQPSPSK